MDDSVRPPPVRTAWCAESTALAARATDFDPHGAFQVICCPAESWLRLQPLIDAGGARKQSHLRDAVYSYSRHGFSITASAGALHIHPNTMKYRLDRWQQLTGWYPRTLDGLLLSLLSITFPIDGPGSSGQK